jgi:peptidoglycan/LPS O-acetylase OafA/YrhL
LNWIGARKEQARRTATGAGRHEPALDGVRALAIAGVLAVHASIWGAVPVLLPGGNLGVQVFFVLSGFLISGRLLSEHARSGDIDLKAFYVRRAARLLPGVLVLLPVYVLVFSHALSTGALALTVGATLLYMSSIVQAVAGAMGNLGFTWSLSVEEHFYALWPPLLRWLLRRRRLWVAAAIALLTVTGATVLRYALSGSLQGDLFGYYASPTRFDAFAIGCLLALAAERVRLPAPRVLGWGGLALVGWCYLQQHYAIGYPQLNLYGLSAAAIGAAALIAGVHSHPEGMLARLFSLRPIVHIGCVSYGLYLWNLLPGQTFRLIAGRHPGVLGTVACALAVLAAVELSYRFVELPAIRLARERLAARRRRERDRRRAGRPERGVPTTVRGARAAASLRGVA